MHRIVCQLFFSKKIRKNTKKMHFSSNIKIQKLPKDKKRGKILFLVVYKPCSVPEIVQVVTIYLQIAPISLHFAL